MEEGGRARDKKEGEEWEEKERGRGEGRRGWVGRGEMDGGGEEERESDRQTVGEETVNIHLDN